MLVCVVVVVGIFGLFVEIYLDLLKVLFDGFNVWLLD